jgi:hypothetical protein
LVLRQAPHDSWQEYMLAYMAAIRARYFSSEPTKAPAAAARPWLGGSGRVRPTSAQAGRMESNADNPSSCITA